jgi:hypothetical protein
MNAFNGQVMQENLYGKFSDYYGKVLSDQASTASSNLAYSDENLLKQNLDALRDAIKRIRAAKEEAIEINRKQTAKIPDAVDNSIEIETLINDEGVIKPIEDLIALGEEPGMTFPRYLRIQMEKGLDKAMEGSVVAREGYEYLYEFYKAMSTCPHDVEKAKRKLDLFDELGAKSKFGIPNLDEINFGHRRIDHEFEPSIIQWKNITDRWETMLWDLYNWSLAHVSKAPYIEPWSLADNPQKAIKYTKDTQPGIFRQRERLFKKYYDMDFPDILKHPTFEYQIKNDLMWQSQELFEFLIEKVYPVCQPFQFLPQNLINEREALYTEKREMNPDMLKPALRFAAFYDKKFGEGRYVSKFGAFKPVVTNAKPWNRNF